MVLPLAGNPTVKRTVTKSELISQAVRSKTFCPQTEVEIEPLLPEPFALKL